MNLPDIQAALRDSHNDCWLFYDHHHRDAIAYSVLGLPQKMMVTRRWSASLRDTVAALRVSGDPLSGPLDTFLSEPDVAKRLPILHGIIETVCSTKLVGGGREGKPNLQGFM